MGAPDDEIGRFTREMPQHQVTVPSCFFGKYPVTQEQWDAVMGDNPSKFRGETRPVEMIAHDDALQFCEKLSARHNRLYRLPSEAEWEYACRAGTSTPFHFGSMITSELANYDATHSYATEPTGDYRGETTPVGSFLPNGFGLYDMHGNVWEWCADPWHPDYEDAPRNGAVWEDGGDESLRVMRGGAWDILPKGCRSAFRDFDSPDNREASYGLRVVMDVER